MTTATVPYITIFGITFHIDPVAFTLPIGDGFPIYWYAVIIATGTLLAMIYAFRRAPKFGINTDNMFDVVIVSFIMAIVGARAYYLIFDGKPLSSFSEIFALRQGGLAIYGGVIGAFATGAIMCRIKKVNMLAMFDLTAIGLLIGQAIGRWGNFVNQEAYGTTTESIFGMTGSRIGTTPVHPCFLYESLLCAAGFVLLHLVSRHRKFDGQLITLYMVWYGTVRFFIEGLRTDSLMIGILRVSQVLSFVLVIAGIVLYFLLLKRSKRIAAEEGEYKWLFENADDVIGNSDSAESAETTASDGAAETDETAADDVETDETVKNIAQTADYDGKTAENTENADKTAESTDETQAGETEPNGQASDETADDDTDLTDSTASVDSDTDSDTAADDGISDKQ